MWYYLDLRGSREVSSSARVTMADEATGPVMLAPPEEEEEAEIEADFAWPLVADLLGGRGGAPHSATALDIATYTSHQKHPHHFTN